VNGSKVHDSKVIDGDENKVKVNTLILSTDGNYSLNGGDDGRVELRDAWTLDLLHTFPKCDTSINYLSLTHDQQTLIAAMKSGSVVAFKIDFTRWHPCKRGIFTGKN
jgi:WD40 repeat protein